MGCNELTLLFLDKMRQCRRYDLAINESNVVAYASGYNSEDSMRRIN